MDNQTEALTDAALLALSKLHSRLDTTGATALADDVSEMMWELERHSRRLVE